MKLQRTAEQLRTHYEEFLTQLLFCCRSYVEVATWTADHEMRERNRKSAYGMREQILRNLELAADYLSDEQQTAIAIELNELMEQLAALPR